MEKPLKAVYDTGSTHRSDLGTVNYCILSSIADKSPMSQLKWVEPGFQPMSPQFLTILHANCPTTLCFCLITAGLHSSYPRSLSQPLCLLLVNVFINIQHSVQLTSLGPPNIHLSFLYLI